MAHEVARLASAKKASEITILAMADAVGYTDYFVICSGANARQTRAISDAVLKGLREQKVRPARVEGEREGEWILLDLIDVVMHVFTPAARDFYRLESLWNDVPHETFDESVMSSATGVQA
jgi:ribosome-associated protein